MTPYDIVKQRRKARLISVAWSLGFGIVLIVCCHWLRAIKIDFLRMLLTLVAIALFVTLDKVIVRRALSVTVMFSAVAIVAVFAPFYGTSSILNLSLVLCGWCFDVTTNYETRYLRINDVIKAHLTFGVALAASVWGVYVAHAPGAAIPVARTVGTATALYFVVAPITAAIVYRAIRRGRADVPRSFVTMEIR